MSFGQSLSRDMQDGDVYSRQGGSGKGGAAAGYRMAPTASRTGKGGLPLKTTVPSDSSKFKSAIKIFSKL